MTNALDFSNAFYGIKITPKDRTDFKKFSKIFKLRKKGLNSEKISKILKLPKSTLEKWVYESHLPFIIKLQKHFQNLGKPGGNKKWLPVNSTRGSKLIGPWITVPTKIKNFKEIKHVLNQLTEIEDFETKNKRFNFPMLHKKRELLLAYLLGVMIGDSSKPSIKRRNRTNRRITVRLTTAKTSNEQLGEFISLCASGLGLRMKRCKDCPAGKLNTHPFYTWISQSSELIQWMFNVCLGLKDNEKTTYQKVKANWILNSPKGFKISFIQGLADSDGFVDFTSQQAAVITHPNTKLVDLIFKSLNIKTRKWLITHNSLWCIVINVKDAHMLPLFNPYVKSYRYEKLIKLFEAKKITGHWPKYLSDKVESFLKAGLTGTKIVEKIIEEDGIAIRTKNIRRRKIEMENKGMISLGIESTAL